MVLRGHDMRVPAERAHGRAIHHVFTLDEQIGRKLFERRTRLGLTQADLGDIVGVRFQTIQKYECGQVKISASRLWAISLALDVPVAYFFREDGDTETVRQAFASLSQRIQLKLLALAQSLLSGKTPDAPWPDETEALRKG